MAHSLTSITSRRLSQRASRGFTLIELLVVIALITVLEGILLSGKVNKTNLKSETYEFESQTTFFNLESEVELECALDDGWVSVIDPENPGSFVLKNSPEGERSYGIELASDLTKANSGSSAQEAEATLEDLEDPINTGGMTFRTAGRVSYRFDEVAQKCLATLSMQIPRDEVFEKVSNSEWQSRESELRLNIISRKVFAPGELVPLLPEIYGQIFAANPNGLQFNVAPIRYEVRADMSGVLVGTGASGESTPEVKSLQAPAQLNAEGAMGCGLIKNSSHAPSTSVWLVMILVITSLGFIGLRRRTLEQRPQLDRH